MTFCVMTADAAVVQLLPTHWPIWRTIGFGDDASERSISILHDNQIDGRVR